MIQIHRSPIRGLREFPRAPYARCWKRAVERTIFSWLTGRTGSGRMGFNNLRGNPDCKPGDLKRPNELSTLKLPCKPPWRNGRRAVLRTQCPSDVGVQISQGAQSSDV
jgi:hypothetical protein